ncbi:MAG: histidine--tRNA ligase [Bdellovibrionales bacterium]
MGSKKQIIKPKPISGYPEWLPEVRHVEQQWLDHIRAVFEGYGFCSIETPAVEALEVIAAKGEDVDKEIYVLERLQAQIEEQQEARRGEAPTGKNKDARLALHFDQTVPLARYVGQHFNDLVFPFKRYQMQKVWRGERPQAGRFREFTQCDIDVINIDTLPLHFDAEMPAIIYEALSGLNLPPFQIRISNRKILIGLLEALGIQNIAEVTRIIDKLEKLGEDKIVELLKEHDLKDTQINEIIKLVSFRPERSGAEETSQAANGEDPSHTFGMTALNDTMREGIDELSFIMDQLAHLPDGAVVADLSIVRGLDYYTGTVYETVFLDDPSYGSICSGGRYDDLASNYINKNLPGVGISIGFSRLFSYMQSKGLVEARRVSPADVLVILNSEEDRALSAQTAATLRANGHKVELYHAPQKFSKQMAYAEKKGIPYVWMPPYRDTAHHEVKNMATGEQIKADPDDWKV